jgi:MOSC domain-containing protein YiiM
MYSIKELEKRLPQIGKVDWIGVRTKTREDIKQLHQVGIDKDKGLEGDHYSGKPGSSRQVTLIQAEHLAAVAAIMQKDRLDPALTRRNIVISGINLLALKKRKFSIGAAILEGTGNCAPCSRMEENLGEGGWNAMRGHGGITAKVLKSGVIKIGDIVKVINN